MTQSKPIPKPGSLRAGAAMVDITPKAGAHLGGAWGILRPAGVIADRLYARALVIESDGRKLCFVCPDLLLIVQKYTHRIRQSVAQRCQIDPDAIMVHLAQAHSTPPLGNFLVDDAFPNIPAEHEYLRGAQSEYCEFAVEKIVEAIVQANNRLHPAQIAAGSGAGDGLAFNRRGEMRDGKVHLEGPTDPEVGVFCLRDEAMSMVAMLLHFTCHPVNVFATLKHAVSSDWPGAWAETMQNRFGSKCVPLVLNGCCGNINPWPAFASDFVPDHRRMGRELAVVSEKVIHTLRFEGTTTLDWRVKHLNLPLKKADANARAAAEKLLAENPLPVWTKDNPRQASLEWMDAAFLMSVELERERSPQLAYEIQVFRIGDMAFVGLPGEPFVEGQLAIKIGSPFHPTYVAHGTTDYAGYIAPRDSYARGGHEIRSTPAKWAKLEAGALEAIVETTIELLKEMKK